MRAADSQDACRVVLDAESREHRVEPLTSMSHHRERRSSGWQAAREPDDTVSTRMIRSRPLTSVLVILAAHALGCGSSPADGDDASIAGASKSDAGTEAARDASVETAPGDAVAETDGADVDAAEVDVAIDAPGIVDATTEQATDAPSEAGAACTLPVPAWSDQWGNAGNDYGYDVAVDPTGRIFVGGEIEGPVDFGTGVVGANVRDGYVAALDATGTTQWVTGGGATDDSSVEAIAADPSGNGVFLTGNFHQSIDFGGPPVTQAPSGAFAAFVGKLDASGKPIWLRALDAGTAYGCQALAVAADAAGNGVFSGWFDGAVDFGGGVFPSDAGSVAAGYVTKYDGAGALRWAKTAIGLSPDALTVDGAGNVLVGGRTGAGADLGGGPFAAAGIFVAKLAPSGAHIWSHDFAVTVGFVSAIATDDAGDVFIAGNLRGTDVDLGQGAIAAPAIYVAKFDADGTLAWTRRYATKPQPGFTASAFALAADHGGQHLALGGDLYGNLDLGGGPLANPTSHADAFLAKLDGTGAHVWSGSFGGIADDATTAVTFAPDGRILATGYTEEKITWCDGTSTTAHGARDAWVAAFAP
jgi:hypothetical protein